MSYKTYEVTVHHNGTKKWHLNGKPHREDGPAIEFCSGEKYWFLNGDLHREDGPAIEYVSGGMRWYLNGKEYSEEKYNKEMNNRNNSCDGEIVEIKGKKYELKEIK